MAVVWMQNQLALNKTQELILNYINQVSLTDFERSVFMYHVVLYFA
jgi:hypothetical protein